MSIAVPIGNRQRVAQSEQILFGLVVLIAALVLLPGWLFGSKWLTQVYPGGAVMVPSTALCFILAAATQALRDVSGSRMENIRRLFAAIVAVISFADLAIAVIGAAPGVDALYAEQFTGTGSRTPSMSPATAICFLLAIAPAILPTIGRAHTAAEASATGGILIVGVTLTCYVIKPAALEGVFVFAAMAFHTAVLFLLLFTGILLRSPESTWIHLIADKTPQATRTRRLFFIVILAPLLIGFVAVKSTDAGWFEPDFRAAFFSVMLMAIGGGAVLANARAQEMSEARLRQTIAELETVSADRATLLREVYHRVKNNLQQIDALLWTEARKHRGSPAVQISFEAMSGRIQAVGLVHRLLLQRANLSNIHLGEFLMDLSANINEANGLSSRSISLTMTAADEEITLSTATTIGLLINEIVTNSIRHAFPRATGGNIAVTYGPGSGDSLHRVLVVKDDGAGFDLAGESDRRRRGTGTFLIRSLVGQLGAEITMESHHGTTVTIRIPQSVLKEMR
ncbi:sensor histidine kinase [Jiella endophytica]|uniref:histidine kinase n=1 Tax=Jiella endophytica TaxID=2558362 RepID=A0A4Y8R8M7_9HYPH|nr:sensor histidine kinase [Jiella endophytica]TFF17216.1 sensor histidine kinase [Jiella endophytica]